MNYKRVKLADHKSANCSIRLYDNGDIVFQSYATDVLYYRNHLSRLYCSGTYSPTTRKQIGWFLKEYFLNLSYQDCKIAYHQDCRINVNVVTHLSLTPLLPEELHLMRDAHNGVTLYPNNFIIHNL